MTDRHKLVPFACNSHHVWIVVLSDQLCKKAVIIMSLSISVAREDVGCVRFACVE